MATLFDTLRVGNLDLPNRIFLAPMTRLRGTVDFFPRPDLMAKYYVQRASAGLIISECTPVDRMAIGYAQVPGIWSEQQVEGWKPVVEAVRRAGGRIFAQIWHAGRVSHPLLLDGQLPLAPSALAPKGHVSLVRPQVDYVTPRALERSEVHKIVDQFRRAAENAKVAGFDGVELHGGNGYLLDQFLESSTNHREDEYGGSVENRARLMLQCTDAVIEVFGPGRVGMHLSPRGDTQSMGDSNPAKTFGYVARELGRRKIAFLMSREREGPDQLGPMLKKEFGGVYVMNEGFTLESATRVLAAGVADAVGFGKAFLANPDLPRRLLEGATLNQPRQEHFYSHEEIGYTDYPALP